MIALFVPSFAMSAYLPIQHFINGFTQMMFFLWCRTFPRLSRRVLRSWTSSRLPKHIDMDPHFNPKYMPWEQRMLMIPGDDFFAALRAGKGDIVTGQIETLTPAGIRMQDGSTIEADIIVQATSLELVFNGGADLVVD